MALLKAQDPLRLHAERGHAQVGPSGQQRFPDVQPVARRNVQLIAELAGEADPPEHAVADPGDPAGPDVHVGERLVGQVDALGDPLDQPAGGRAGHVDAGVGRGHRRDVDPPVGALGLQPVLDPLPDRRRAR